MHLRLPALLLAALPFTLADIKVVSPAAGATVPGTGALTITFTDGGQQPSLAQLGQIQVFLLAGGNNVGTDTMQVVAGAQVPISGSSTTLTLTPASGPSTGTTNAFYLKIVSIPTAGGASVINYSSRFTVTGMTGTWAPPQAQAAAAALAASPNSVPQAQVGSGSGSGGASSSAGSANSAPAGDWGVPHPSGTWPAYSLQSGATKYAPMQGRPGRSITQTNTSPLYPTSSWSVFQTFYPIPVQVSTQTPSPTMSAVSRENTASAAASPANDMERFLARWKD